MTVGGLVHDAEVGFIWHSICTALRISSIGHGRIGRLGAGMGMGMVGESFAAQVREIWIIL